jgi:Ser/Thr protein kinase RdoA (MazF antagonist)
VTFELAQAATAFWPFETKALKLAAHRENAVYRWETTAGIFALRLHRVGYRSDDELRSEIQVMRALADAGCAVPAPIASNSGDDLVAIEHVQVTALSWMDGVPMGETGKPFAHENRIGIFTSLGETIAKMHNAIDHWVPPPNFQRVHWNADGLLGEAPHWGQFWNNPDLSAADKTLVLRVRERVRQHLDNHTWDYGYIHADLVSENVLVDGDTIRMIDFDDSGFGYRLQDIATALVKHHAEPDYAQMRAALIAGYSTHRALDVEHIDMFLLIRKLSYLGWIMPRMGDAAGKARAARFLREAVAAAQAYDVAAK